MSLRLERRGLVAIALGTVAILLGSATPARAVDDDYFGVTLRYAGEFAGFRLAAAAGYEGPRHELSVGYAQTPSPDILFTSPTGFAPPPSPCIAASAQVIRCPYSELTIIRIETGPGADVIEMSGAYGPSVAGLRVRIEAGAGNDRWGGGDAGEAFIGGRGNDLGRGRGGRDRLIGGRGNDRLFGGPRVDFFLGGPGMDFARGGGGDDRGFGGPGRDDFQD